MHIKHLLLIIPAVILASCGEGEEEGGNSQTTQGWHMQGRNCLACHNVDLQPVRHLTVAGTVFKTQNISNPDDLTQVCGGNLRIQLIDSSGNITYDSKDYKDPNSKGYKGKGNIFILSRKLPNIQGDYYIKIVDENNNTLATSATLHQFTSGYYDNSNPADPSNRYSCNACHSVNPQGGAPGVIYVYPSVKNLCK